MRGASSSQSCHDTGTMCFIWCCTYSQVPQHPIQHFAESYSFRPVWVVVTSVVAEPNAHPARMHPAQATTPPTDLGSRISAKLPRRVPRAVFLVVAMAPAPWVQVRAWCVLESALRKAWACGTSNMITHGRFGEDVIRCQERPERQCQPSREARCKPAPEMPWSGQ